MNAKLAASPARPMEAHAHPARPSLSVRCPTPPLGAAAITELAMTIAEEIASLSRSPQPIGVDVPLVHSGLDPKSLSKLQSWLKSAHDYDVTVSRLLENDMTAEVLAADIEGVCHMFALVFSSLIPYKHPPARAAAEHCPSRRGKRALARSPCPAAPAVPPTRPCAST